MHPPPLDSAHPVWYNLISIDGCVPLLQVGVGRVGNLWGVLRYCRNVHPTWVEFVSKDTKESGVVFEVLSTKSKKRT